MQTSFTDPIDRSKEVIRRCASQFADDAEIVNIAVSGGTDSVVAADVICRYGPELGIDPDVITHINTGAGVPQTKLVAKIVADMHGLDFVEQGYRNQRNALGPRVLRDGWPPAFGSHPTELGHGREWANRKDKPMDAVDMMFDGLQIWISGVRKLESGRRQGNVPDNGILQDKPRRVWLSPIVGWTSEEKRKYIRERGLPVSEAYLFLGFSGECTACSFDDQGLLTDLDILSPELAYCIRTLTVWLYLRVRRGDVDLDPKQLCWGWSTESDQEITPDEYDTFGQEITGCDKDSCKTIDERPTWILELPDEQIVTRKDVQTHWDTNQLPQRFPV